MAVLKYKSNGTIKTLGITQSGASSVTSVNGKTGAVTGLYDADNPPPYPVSSVNGKTGAVTGLYDANNPPPQTIKSAVVTLQKDESHGGYFFPADFPQNKVSKFIKAYFETLPSETTSVNNIFIFGTTTEGNGVRVVIAGLALDITNNGFYLNLWDAAPSISVRVYYEE